MISVCGLWCFDPGGDAGDEASSADGGQHGVDIRLLFEDLFADGALPRDDHGVVVRRDPDHAFFLGLLLGVQFGLQAVVAVEGEFDVVVFERFDFGGLGVLGQVDQATVAGDRQCAGEALGVVTGGGGHQSVGFLFGRHRQYFVQRPARFEGAGDLFAFELEVNLAAVQFWTGRWSGTAESAAHGG